MENKAFLGEEENQNQNDVEGIKMEEQKVLLIDTMMENHRDNDFDEHQSNDFEGHRGNEFEDHQGNDFKGHRGNKFEDHRGNGFKENRGNEFEDHRGNDLEDHQGKDFEDNLRNGFKKHQLDDLKKVISNDVEGQQGNGVEESRTEPNNQFNQRLQPFTPIHPSLIVESIRQYNISLFLISGTLFILIALLLSLIHI